MYLKIHSYLRVCDNSLDYAVGISEHKKESGMAKMLKPATDCYTTGYIGSRQLTAGVSSVRE